MAKSLTLYSHKTGPNPWKVAIVLEELGLEYETIYLDMNTSMFLSHCVWPGRH